MNEQYLSGEFGNPLGDSSKNGKFRIPRKKRDLKVSDRTG